MRSSCTNVVVGCSRNWTVFGPVFGRLARGPGSTGRVKVGAKETQTMQKKVDTRRLGDFIKRARERHGFSIRGLATAATVDATWVMRLERGEYSSPDPWHLKEIARVLELEMGDLFYMAGYQDGQGLPTFAPYLRARYDLPGHAIEQLEAHFELVDARLGGRDAIRDES